MVFGITLASIFLPVLSLANLYDFGIALALIWRLWHRFGFDLAIIYVLVPQQQLPKLHKLYIEDPTNHGWSVVLKMTNGEYFPNINSSDDNALESTTAQQIQPFEREVFDESRITREEDAMWLRDGIDFITVDQNDAEKGNYDAMAED